MRTLAEIAEEAALDEKKLEKLEKIILDHETFCGEAVRNEIDWFCTTLGMNEYYFETTPLKTIASHIEAIKAAEIIADIQKEKIIKIDLGTEGENEAVYLVDDYHHRALEVEKRIEKKYPNFRLQSYRTKGKAMGVEHLRMYVVYKPRFAAAKSLSCETNLERIAPLSFLATATKETKKRYQKILSSCQGWETPYIEVSRKKESNELRIMVAAQTASSRHFFSNVSDVINSHGIVSKRKYVEPFNNGKTVYAFYLDGSLEENTIQNLIGDMSLIYVIHSSPLSDLFRQGQLSAQETVFGVSAWSFAHQFLSEYDEEYVKLIQYLKDSPELLGITRNLRTRLANVAYDEARVWEALLNNLAHLKKAFYLFDKKFNPRAVNHDIEKEMSEFRNDIHQNISVEIDRNIFLSICLFIDSTLRTNFYKKEKTSISFMYDPKFLNRLDYPELPFGINHVIATEMRGFHIRFRNVARGGIRIVGSGNLQNYLTNSDSIFDENYNLAFTQQKKNKDIPEGGSKGTILLRWGYQPYAETAFKKYINGLLDLMLPEEDSLDYHGKEVFLYLGPDEGTADLMEWAALRAKQVGFPYWRAFSTGKPLSMGGIPHDLYGMTTRSVHQYVLKILEKEGKKEKDITKVMTGGPDGDLGSNEILISKDTIKAIVDGSGVIYDPEGLDRKELKRLARARKTVKYFNRSLLSKKGFMVSLEDRNVKLPHGETVSNGLEFRNAFHLHPLFEAELFVPCGGRPNSININNWKFLVDSEGKPRFRYIVEGANLFITQDARLRLEEKGVIIYKDASANKGGVTSSSLEVFASLAMTDAEFEEHMLVKNSVVPAFRKIFIEEILKIIEMNAANEFEVIWREHERDGTPRSILTDRVSDKINRITDSVTASRLYENKNLFQEVVECCCPRILIEKIGFQKILKRVPESYLLAMFASHLASQYVYKYGLEANEIDFYSYLKEAKSQT